MDINTLRITVRKAGYTRVMFGFRTLTALLTSGLSAQFARTSREDVDVRLRAVGTLLDAVTYGQFEFRSAFADINDPVRRVLQV